MPEPMRLSAPPMSAPDVAGYCLCRMSACVSTLAKIRPSQKKRNEIGAVAEKMVSGSRFAVRMIVTLAMTDKISPVSMMAYNE